MALKDDLEFLRKYVQDKAPTIIHNQNLFEMYEGDLLKFILDDLRAQLSDKSFQLAQHRIAPINILRRLIDKLSKIYNKSPKRIIVDGKEQDQELLDFYVEQMQIDEIMNTSNELFNLHKTTTIEPYIEKGFPRLRPIPSDRAIWYSNDRINPTNPTHFIKFLGEMEVNFKVQNVYYVYTDTEFMVVDAEFKPIPQMMAALDNPQGVNPVGEIPAIYINRSVFSICPPVDTDLDKMVKLFPVLMSDLNFAVMMQSFSIIYGIDVDNQNVVMSPNAFWTFESNPTSDKTPQIGQIKPQVDISEVISFISSQLQLWLNSRNVRPGTIGGPNAESSASGISKIIDESDTSEDRERQAKFFKRAEEDMWELIIKKLHPMWRKADLIDTNLDWSPNVKIEVEFPEQLPLIDRTAVLDDAIKEIGAGLTTRLISIQRLNPGMTETEAEELLAKIEEDKQTQVIETDDDADNTDEEIDNEDDQLDGSETAESDDQVSE